MGSGEFSCVGGGVLGAGVLPQPTGALAAQPDREKIFGRFLRSFLRRGV